MNKRGSLMIESIVAASLIVVGLLGLFNLIYNSTVKDKEVIHRLQATYLAAEGIEVIKSISDENAANGASWNKGFSGGCYSSVSYDTDSGSLGNPEPPPASGNVSFALSTYKDGIFAPSSDLTASGLAPSASVFNRSVCLTLNSAFIDVVSTVSWLENQSTTNVVLEDQFYDWRQ